MGATQTAAGKSESDPLAHLVARDEDARFPMVRFRLQEADDDELKALSERLGIGLSLQEMQRVQEYFKGLGRDPTDVELEGLGQAWSEHCCYKSSKPVLSEYVFGVCENKIALREDAGLVEFDDDHYYAVKLESHNHPSAVEPYGGAATGIGGVLRDVVCMGAQPVALIDPLFFGPPTLRHSDLPAGTRHPRYLVQGVVAGIRDYGNRVGIPTVAGSITFHPNYTTNCLVNVGCVGVVRKDKVQRSRASAAGDVYIYLGGRTGRDGIHGVTFASAELQESSEEEGRGAVQLGDPITKEPLIHACLEAVDAGILVGMKDFGGGGLSCVTGELAHDAGLGAEVDLDSIPLKEPGLSPWEIWVSESQERMMFVVRPENVEKALHICRKWDVEAVVCGKVIEENVVRVNYQGKKVLEFDLEYYTGGPVYQRDAAPVEREETWEDFDIRDRLEKTLLDLLADPNIASKEWAIHQYDQIVRGATVLRPLQGVVNHEGPGDAAVLKPVESSWKGLALTSDINPLYTIHDPYWGSVAAMDEVVRNLAAVGARVSSVADCLNFANPEKPERFGEFRESVKGLGDAARALEVPFSSGNVSLYNESSHQAVPPTPTVLGVGVVEDIRRCVTMDLKPDGGDLLLVGETHRTFGGSTLQTHLGFSGGHGPRPDLGRLKASADAVVEAIEKGLVRAAHDPAEGGVLVALAEMAIGGQVGASLDVDQVTHHHDEKEDAPLRTDRLLFSESPTRWVLQAAKGQEEALIQHFQAAGVPVTRLGRPGGDALVVSEGGKQLLKIPVQRLTDTWKHALGRLLGEHEGGEHAKGGDE
jgi:phosphoribosylformylglycinamidine synthase subunit PurL